MNRSLIAFAFAAAAGQASPEPPPGFTRNVAEVWAAGRGLDAPRWPAPRPLLRPDLGNAEFPAGAWAWEGDVLVGRGVDSWAGGKGNLWTKESYGNFSLSLEFRVPEGANGGIFIRVGDVAAWQHTSTEIQILQGTAENARTRTGALYDLAASRVKNPVEAGRWHTLVIIARGPRIAAFLNAELVNDVSLDEWKLAGENPDGSRNKTKVAPKERPRSGRIGLQYHGKRIEYRNLLIEELPQ
ncbi:MAG: DUF1080 domain-containing protein [Opitutus sp.]|nr:DUF1080 domain-containing protein [Opitutus sp.]